MWKTFLALVTHRLLLLGIALLAINFKLSTPVPGKMFRPLKPYSVLFDEFSRRVSNTPEVHAVIELRQVNLKQVIETTSNPLVWLTWILDKVSSLTPGLLLILLSNFFLFLFLWELHALVGRLSIPEVGTTSAILVVLWVTSYELSLGSAFVIPCMLLTMAVRHAIDDRWLVTGLSLSFLIFLEPFCILIVPILLMYFWQFQRHLPGFQIVRNFLFFFIPTIAIVIWRWSLLRILPSAIHGSALFNVVDLFQNFGEWSWALSKTFLGQTIALSIFLMGAISALVLNTSLIFRVIPIVTLGIVLISTSYGGLASRLLLAATCLGGIGAMSSTFLIRLVQLALLILGAAEIGVLFSA